MVLVGICLGVYKSMFHSNWLKYYFFECLFAL